MLFSFEEVDDLAPYVSSLGLFLYLLVGELDTSRFCECCGGPFK